MLTSNPFIILTIKQEIFGSVRTPPHIQCGSGSMFLKYKCCFNELQCIRSLACSICSNLEPQKEIIWNINCLVMFA